MFKDVRAKKALAMHWGYVINHPLSRTPTEYASRTWVLTAEPVLEPPELLRKECENAGLEADEFLVPALGETVLF